MPCCALIHICHAAPLPCSGSAVSLVKVCMIAGNTRTAGPTVLQIVFFVVCCYHSFPHQWQTVFGFTLATCIWEWYASHYKLCGLRVVDRRSQTRAGSPQAVSRQACCAMALRRTAWSEYGMASVNQTRLHCVNQMGKTHSKPLAAWGRHVMCESAIKTLRRHMYN